MVDSICEYSTVHIYADLTGTFYVRSDCIPLGLPLQESGRTADEHEERKMLSMLVGPSRCKGFSRRELLANASGVAE